jgi:hypothetical protein
MTTPLTAYGMVFLDWKNDLDPASIGSLVSDPRG